MDPATDPGLLDSRKCTPELPGGSFAEPDGSSEPSPKRQSTRQSTNTKVSLFRGTNGVFFWH